MIRAVIVEDEPLGRALDRAKSHIRERRWKSDHLERLIVKSQGRIFFLKTDEVDWIEAEGNYVRLHIKNESHLVAIDATGVRWGSVLIKLGTLAGLSTVMLTTLLGQSRIFFVMAKDGLLPPWVGVIHPRFRTPWISSIVVGLFIATFAGLLPISILGNLVSIGTLFAFIIVCLGVWILRHKRPDLERPFRTPAVPLVPFLGIAVSLLLMLSLPADTWFRLIVWLAIGQAIYFAYGRHHSRV